MRHQKALSLKRWNLWTHRLSNRCLPVCHLSKPTHRQHRPILPPVVVNIHIARPRKDMVNYTGTLIEMWKKGWG